MKKLIAIYTDDKIVAIFEENGIIGIDYDFNKEKEDFTDYKSAKKFRNRDNFLKYTADLDFTTIIKNNFIWGFFSDYLGDNGNDNNKELIIKVMNTVKCRSLLLGETETSIMDSEPKHLFMREYYNITSL